MKYQAVCKLHTDFAAPEREEYAVALDDLAIHQEAAHFIGVAEIDDDQEPSDSKTGGN